MKSLHPLKRIFLVGSLLSLMTSPVSEAALLNPAQNQLIRGTVEPGRSLQSFLPNNNAAPRATGGKAVFPQPAASRFSQEALKVHFKLTHLELEGVTVFSKEALLKPYQSYIGKDISLGQVQQIAEQMTTVYQKAGYVLSHVIIPPQQIKEGRLTLRAVEGFVSNVSIEGEAKPNVQELLLKYGRYIQASRPLHIHVLERYALLANDLPGITARIVLKPSKKVIGAADLVFVTTQKTLDGYISFDNRGTRYLGPEQVSALINANSFLRPGDVTSISGLKSEFNHTLYYLNATRSDPIGTNGLKLTSVYAHNRSEPGSTLSQFNIVGISDLVDFDLSYPIIRLRNTNLYVHGGTGALDSSSVILNTNLYNDEIRYFDLGISWSHLDSLNGASQAQLNFTHGIKWLGSSAGQNNISVSRLNAKPTFLRWNATVSRFQALPYDFSIAASATGQYSPNSLYAAEQFGFGGPEYGRGYDPSEITGDRGIAAKAELRYQHWINQYYAFYDIGKVWNYIPIAQPAIASGASTGFGIRSSLTNWLAANLEVAQPLTRKVAAEDNARHPRIYFSITASSWY